MYQLSLANVCIYTETALSVCCALLFALLIIALVALVSACRVLKQYKMEAKLRVERVEVEMKENEAYGPICTRICDNRPV